MTQRGKRMKRVLFVCTGNTCRSPMAELIFNKIARERGVDANARSAGLCTIEGLLINDNAEAALREIGIESDFFSSTDIYDLDFKDYDLFVGMTAEHIAELKSAGIDESKIRMLGEKNGGIRDPYGSGLWYYKYCRDEITKALEEILAEL